MKHNGREDEGAAHVSRRKFMAQAATAGGAGLAVAHGLNAQENSNKAQPAATPAKPAVSLLGTKIYPNAGHCFFNDTRAQAHNAEAAADAWQRTLKFFSARLGK